MTIHKGYTQVALTSNLLNISGMDWTSNCNPSCQSTREELELPWPQPYWTFMELIKTLRASFLANARKRNSSMLEIDATELTKTWEKNRPWSDLRGQAKKNKIKYPWPQLNWTFLEWIQNLIAIFLANPRRRNSSMLGINSTEHIWNVLKLQLRGFLQIQVEGNHVSLTSTLLNTSEINWTSNCKPSWQSTKDELK